MLEWFRTEPRPSVHAALLPAILFATFGWLLLSLAGRMIAASPDRVAAPSITAPTEAIVDAEGERAAVRRVPPLERALLLAGTLIVMVSPLLLVYRLQWRSRVGCMELLLRTDALVLREAGEEIVVRWDELEEARLGLPAGAPAKITLARHDGSELELEARFTGITPDELARRIRAVRGRALFGLLEPPAWPERTGER